MEVAAVAACTAMVVLLATKMCPNCTIDTVADFVVQLDLMISGLRVAVETTTIVVAVVIAMHKQHYWLV
jgi:hypothetical protein